MGREEGEEGGYMCDDSGLAGSFLAQLDKDEGDLKKFNFVSPQFLPVHALVNCDDETMSCFWLQSQTPPSQLNSFDMPISSRQGSFADSTGEVSITSYFQRRSNEVGDLVPVKLPPQERVSQSCYSSIKL